jgi:hypothetical protein
MSKKKKSSGANIATIKVRSKTQEYLNILASMRNMTVIDLVEELLGEPLKQQLKLYLKEKYDEIETDGS